METRKLYYEDCHLQNFQARVLSCSPCDGGWAVILDRTAFYPEGGGQACDLGTLNGVRVLDVREEKEQVIHICDTPLTEGSRVAGQLDWARRFDLMQQHSGEHIVSGLIHKHFGWHNVGFHVGAELMEIDFDGPVPQEALAQIEREANRAVFADLPVRCWYPEQEALQKIFYRTKKQLAWPVRLVQIADVDSCACCGVHVARTGEIGLIKIVSCVKFHQGVRLQLCCGERAVGLMQAVFEENRQVSQTFSAKMLETGEAARRQTAMLAEEKLRANMLQSQVFACLAEGCKGKGNTWMLQKDLEPARARELADKIADVCGGWAAVISGAEGSYSICILHKTGDIKDLADALKQQLGARGGGKPGSFQGSVSASLEQMQALLESFR